MSKKKTKMFDDFPATIYIMHRCGELLAFDDEVEAAEYAQENDSELAKYIHASQGHVQVEKKVTYD